MIEVPWEICGSDTLGIHPITHFDSPQRKRIPIPPTMDTQLDQIVIQRILNPLRAKVVRKFEQLITPAKPEAWFEVYLSAFILLNHIERLAKHSVFHARRHVMPVSGEVIQPPNPPPPLYSYHVVQVLQHRLPGSRISHSQEHPGPVPLRV